MAASSYNLPNFSKPEADPIRNFRFLVEIIPLDTNMVSGFNSYLGFNSVEGLSMTINAIPYREGGYNTTQHQLPGQTSFSPITLTRGVIIGSSQNQDWTKAIFSTIAGQGGGKVAQNFRSTVHVKVLDHPMTGQELPPSRISFTIYNAWITSLAYSSLNAGDNALFVEQMTLAHEGWLAKWAGSSTDTADVTPPDAVGA